MSLQSKGNKNVGEKAYLCGMTQFSFSKTPVTGCRTALREGVLPICGVVAITAVLVAVLALLLHIGKDMAPVIPIHVDDGETVDPNPMRLLFMLTAFVLSFFLAAVADRKGKEGKVFPAFWFGYAAGTLLWQSMGECAWHFSLEVEDYLMCFPHIEGASALFMVIIVTILLAYCYKRSAFSWGVWVFVLSFVGNWFGHFVMIGTYPLVHGIFEEDLWFKWSGAVIGALTCAGALLLDFFAARTTKARLCCCLMLYFGLGIILTGFAGI